MKYIKIITLIWSAILLVSIYPFFIIESYKNTFYDLNLIDDSMSMSLYAHLLSISIFAFIFFSIKALFKKHYKNLDNKEVNFEAPINYINIFIATLVFTLSFIASNFLIYGEGLFSRSYYISDLTSPLAIYSSLSGIFAIIFCSLLRFSRDKFIRYVGIFCSLLIFLIFVSKDSRSLVLAYLIYNFSPIFFGYTSHAGFGNKKIVFHLIVSIILFTFILYFRGLDLHGLIPYAESILGLTDNLQSWQSSLSELVLNVGFSLQVTQATIEELLNSNQEYLLASLSPAFGSSWIDIMSFQRVNLYVPYSALGEIYSYSHTGLLIYLCIAAIVFIFHEYVGSRANPTIRLLSLIFGIFCSLSFAYLFLQYNLRSATRMLYYLLIFDILPVTYCLIYSYLRNKITN
jgi:hypothetical protein